MIGHFIKIFNGSLVYV